MSRTKRENKLNWNLAWWLPALSLCVILLGLAAISKTTTSAAEGEDAAQRPNLLFRYNSPLPSLQPATMAAPVSPCEVVWMDDGVPEGATAFAGDDGWNWVGVNPAPYSGVRSHQAPVIAGAHDHYFIGATNVLAVSTGEFLYAYVYLDPLKPPREIMLAWNDGSWEHRAYWGENLINYGTDGTASRQYVGPLPTPGQWTKLEIPASQLGLEGRAVTGLSFIQYDGRASWDRTGKTCLRDKVWVNDSVPAGGIAVGTNESWNWVSSAPSPYFGKFASQSNLVAGFHQHYFHSATATLKVNKGDNLVAYVFIDPANKPSELMLQWGDANQDWEHRAYWGANNPFHGTDGTESRRYVGPLPEAGRWVRLQVPAKFVGLEGKTLAGMAFSMWDGRAAWDYAGTSPSSTTAWVDDSVPAGAIAFPGTDGWNWITSNPAPISGTHSHQTPVAASMHDHYFTGAAETLTLATGDVFYAHVYLDPISPPREIMLSWNDGNWGYRAYWGENLINAGVNGTISRKYMGPLPPAGQWVRLEVPASQVGLEGRTLTGMSFLQYDGRASWDEAGKYSSDSNPGPTPTPTPIPTPTPTPTPAPSPVVLLSFEGKVRDRVSQNETTLSSDGMADGAFTVTFSTGTAGRTVTSMRLERNDGINAWDTFPNNGTWALGLAGTLDGGLLNSSNGAVNLNVTEGAAFKIFVSDTSALFGPAATFTLNVNFSNGSVARSTIVLDETSQNFSLAQLDPRNRVGLPAEDLLSGNYNWTMPMVSLEGRSGLDLGLSFVYNSLVWTRTESSIKFNADNGFPGPGFRLGFPVITPQFFNPQTGKNAYLVIMPSGERVELRQVSENTYESADSSYLQLTVSGSVLAVKTTNGTRLSFTLAGGEYHCTEIKDRNGNFITINNDTQGRINTITDTVGRVLTFNYDPANGTLTSITQPWNVNGQTLSHKWAEFGYKNIDLQTNFGALTMIGAQNGQSIRVLEKVTYADGSRYQFSYTSWGQVYEISRFAGDGSQLRYTKYNLPGSSSPQTIPLQTDCPRFTERRDSARNWNGAGDIPGAASEVATQFSFAAFQGNGVGEITMPDGVVIKEFFATSGWQNGLTQKAETWSAPASANGVLKRTVTTAWTQDNESLTFKLNPRPADVTVVDGEGNRRRRTHYEYNDDTDANVKVFGLVSNVTEFGSNDASPLRRSQFKYNHAAAYLSNRVIGLVREHLLYDAQNGLASKTTLEYDQAGFLEATIAAARQHDSGNFGVGFREGRGNLSRTRRWDVNDSANISKTLVSELGYNTTGAPIFTRFFSYNDAGTLVARQTNFSYADPLNSFAYPTKVTDPDGNAVQAVYNYDLGVSTSVTDPKGASRTTLYDGVTGRVMRTELNNRVNAGDPDSNSYTRFVYSPADTSIETYTRVDVGNPEVFSAQVFDGVGRVRGTISAFPGSAGGYRAQRFTYDRVGQLVEQSNPTEVSVDPAQRLAVLSWNTAGDDAADGWQWGKQAYDWKGRPTVTTNVDGTQRTLSYEGCGCAGNEVITSSDEVGRKQKSYADALGRVTKIEVLNLNHTVNATIVNLYNALDQVTNVKRYQGIETSGVFQEASLTYDGYGRVATRHLPGQADANNQPLSTTFSYNPDDTLKSVKDARGATTDFFYNARQLVKKIAHNRPINPATNQPKVSVLESATVEFGYDEAGNKKWMIDGLGRVDYNFDKWSTLKSETRYFNDILAASPSSTGETRRSFTLSYEYTLSGQLKKLTDEAAGTSITYGHDEAGQMMDVKGTGFGPATQTFISSMQYRAAGALKGMKYGNSVTLSLGYNKRGLLINYGLGVLKDSKSATSAPEGGNFQYYPDGQLRFASDLRTATTAGGMHDRAFAYDDLGRLKEAYSGTQARDFRDGTSTPIFAAVPFRQTYSYDTWGNLTGRTGRFWSADDVLTETYNKQDRNINWEYDEDGRLISRNEASPNGLTYEPLRNTFDSAGRLVQQSQLTTKPPRSSHLTETKTTVTNIRSYDGNGLAAKITRKTQINSNAPSSGATYYLFSTVLGGRAVSEYNPSGVRLLSSVFAGGGLVANQKMFTDGSTKLLWEHTNPVVGDQINTNTLGEVVARTTVDPTGVNVGDSDPFATSSEPNLESSEGMSQASVDAKVAQLVPGFGSMQCSVNNLAASCGFISGLISSGAAKACPNNYCGPVRLIVTGENEDGEATRTYLMSDSFKAYSDGVAGYTPLGMTYVGDGLLLNDFWKGEFQADSNKLSFNDDFNIDPLEAAKGNLLQSETSGGGSSKKRPPASDDVLTLPFTPSLEEVLSDLRQRDERIIERSRRAKQARHDLKVRRMIEEGEIWDRWQKWGQCADEFFPEYNIKYEALMAKYDSNLFFGGASASANTYFQVAKSGASTMLRRILWPIFVLTTIDQVGKARQIYIDMKALNQLTHLQIEKKCGARPPKPSGVK